MTEEATSTKPKKPKRPLTSAEKRARTRRRNVIKKRAGIRGKDGRTAIVKLEELTAAITALSDTELKEVSKIIKYESDYRKSKRRILTSIYKRI